MLRPFIFLLLSSTFVLATSNYTVRLAVFKNVAKLQKSIESYPPALKETIKTYKRNGLMYAYTIPTADRETLKKLLPAYKKVFKDAYIQPTRMK
jgi:hypothetical protein